MKLTFAFCAGMLAAATAAAQGGSTLPAGMFSTLGNQIVDQNQNPVRLSCVYWQGMNAEDGTLSNLTSPFNGYQANINAIAAPGFNCVRVDINNISLHHTGTAAFLEELDSVVSAATAASVRIIIVDHDNEGNYGSNDNYADDCAAQQANGIWYDLGGASNGTDGCNDPGHTTQASFQSDWVSIAARYAGNDTVIGYDLWNEPLSYGDSVWGGGGDNDIHLMYETVGSAMLSLDPTKLIFAECPQNYGPATLFDGVTTGNAPWGDCTGVKSLPVVFTVNGSTITNQVVYDVHLYPNSVSGISSLFGSSSSASAIQAMSYSFGFLESQNIAPVWDGESGTGFQINPDDQNWATMLNQYLNGELASQGGPAFSGNQQGMGIAWMSWNTQQTGAGSDNLGILGADGSLIPAQQSIVDPLIYFGATAPAVRILATPVTVSPGASTGNTSSIAVTPGGGFTGTVTLAAAITSSPTGAQNPPSFSFASGDTVSLNSAIAATVTLTVSTTAPSASAAAVPQRRGVPFHAAGGAALACILLFCIPRRLSNWRFLLGAMALFMALAAGPIACGSGGGGTGGGGGTSNPGTTAGTYVVTVTGTSGAVTASGTFAVTVQ